MPQFISFLGLIVFMLMAWAMSNNRRIIPWRIITGGILLQLALGWLILRTTPGRWVFSGLTDFFKNVLDYVDSGAVFLFGSNFHEHFFAFKVLPTIVFFSAFISVMYHFGIMQRIVAAMAFIMQKALRTSGAETLAAAVNIFVGQTEAPLLVRPYVRLMTDSELMAIMVGGFANIAGGVLAAYVGMGIDAGHLIASSVISAPASLLIAKLMVPETETPVTLGEVTIDVKVTTTNFVDALATGATEGMSLAINVAAMLIAFLAMIALVDHGFAWVGSWFGYEWSLTGSLGFLFAPIAWIMGVPAEEMFHVGQLLGLKMIANEFVAYEKLATWLQPGSEVVLSERAQIISTYALCGFANIGSIGIQIGGISPMAPEKRGTIARLAFRAMIGGSIATFMTACIAGVLV